jgi:hypothetical protein
MTNQKPTRKRNKKIRKNVKTVLGIQPLHLIEGDELDRYATEFSEEELRRADQRARRSGMLEFLYATVIEGDDDET